MPTVWCVNQSKTRSESKLLNGQGIIQARAFPHVWNVLHGACHLSGSDTGQMFSKRSISMSRIFLHQAKYDGIIKKQNKRERERDGV